MTELEPAEPRNKPRRWWVAALLTLLPPVGLLYAGAPRLYLFALGAAALQQAALPWGAFDWAATLPGLYALVALSAVAAIVMVFGPVGIALARRKRYRLRWYNRPWIYALAAMPLGLGIALEPDPPPPVETFTMTGASMAPSIRDGEYLLANQREGIRYRLTAGDVVIVRQEHRGAALLLRLIGMPGERVRLVEGVPEIDGILVEQQRTTGTIDDGSAFGGASQGAPIELWHERLPNGRSYRIARWPDRAPRRTTPPVTLGDGEVFLLGDNRENALDSTMARPAGLGIVRLEEISGRLTGIYWSDDPERIGLSFAGP